MLGSESWKTRLGGRAPAYNRGKLTLRQRPTGNLILPGEPDALVALCVFEEAVEGANPIGMATKPVVHADHHHPTPGRSLGVELVKLIAQRLLVGKRII